MLENCVIVDTKYFDNGARLGGRKPAKLSTYKTFYPKTKEVMNRLRAVTETPSPTLPTPDPVDNVVSFEPKPSITQAESTTPVANKETPRESNTILFPTPKEVLEKKVESLAVTVYNDLLGKVVNLDAYRRLKVNPLVQKMLIHAKKVIGLTPEVIVKQKQNPFDFGQVSNISTPTTPEPKEVEQPKTVSNVVHIDNYDWLRKEINQTNNLHTNNETKPVEDGMIVEFSSLMKEKMAKQDSLATQKEILENLRKKIEQNKALCEAKKQELIEENMALTQELNDVLAEINQLSDIASQQESFLGIEQDEDTKKIAS